MAGLKTTIVAELVALRRLPLRAGIVVNSAVKHCRFFMRPDCCVATGAENATQLHADLYRPAEPSQGIEGKDDSRFILGDFEASHVLLLLR